METKELPLQKLALRFFETRSEKDFTVVYRRMKPGINSYLKDMVKNADDREEVMATAFSKVWSKIHQYDPYWNFSTWVYRIALNEARLFFRGKRKTYSFEAMEEMGINMESKLGYDEITEYEEDITPTDRLAEAVLDEIRNLPDMYKTVLTLREIEKKKYEDIATELGWKTNTVRTRIHKARGLIRSTIKKNEPELLKKYQDLL